jgi:hypothetical protein
MQQRCLGLLQSSGIRDLLEVHFYIVLLLRNVFEDESMAVYVNMRLGDLPNTRAQFATFHVKCSTCFQVSEQTVGYLDIVDQATLQTDNAMLFAVNFHITLHRCKHASLEIGRMKLRIGPEVHHDVISLIVCDGPDKSAREHLQEFGSLFIVMLAAFALLRLRARVIQEGLHFLALFIFRKRLPISLDHTVETHSSRLRDPLFHSFARLAIDFEIEPVGVIVSARSEFSLNGLPDNLARRLCGSGERCGHKGYERK